MGSNHGRGMSELAIASASVNTLIPPRYANAHPSGPRVEQNLRAYARQLAEDPLVLAVVLFGSLARGEATAMSDADVLILLGDSSQPFHERTPDFLRSGVGISLDVFPSTLSEATQALREGWGIVAIALREGVWLVDKERVKERLLAMSPAPEVGP